MDSLVTFTTTVALGAVIYTSVNLIKYLKAQDWNGVLTLLLAAAVGIGIACWAANSDMTAALTPIEGGQALKDMDFGSLALFGVALSSTFSVVADFRSAFDNSDSGAKPPLVGVPTPADNNFE